MATKKSRKAGNKSTGWIRDTVLRIYTQDQVREDWMAIEPVDRLKIVSSWVPKETNSNNTDGLQINLILTGIEGKRVIEVHPITQDALPKHDPD